MRRLVTFWSRGSRAEKGIWVLTLGVIVLRLGLITWNRAEFTDSIIQLQLFENKNRYFPPLYPSLVWVFSFLFGDPIVAGRVVSIFASSLMIPFLWRLGRAVGGGKVGLWSALLFAFSPVPWRWSLHAMGDAFFAFLFLISLTETLLSLPRLSPDGGPEASRRALWGIFFGGLATLTRYQGLILFPLGAAAWFFTRRQRKGIGGIALALIPWGGVLAWASLWGFVHGGQFTERAAPHALSTLRLYGFFAFSFLRFAPLAFGYGVCALAVLLGIYGLFSRGRNRPLIILSIILGGIWLATHSAFQSFQYRYFLPMVPLLCLLAALALQRLGEILRSTFVVGVLGALAVVELSVSSLLVLSGTRNTFADFPEAARYVTSLPTGSWIYSNEMWNPRFLCPKIRYWSGREVGFAALLPQPGSGLVLNGAGLGGDGNWEWSPLKGRGKVIFCWHNVYAPHLDSFIGQLEHQQGFRVVYRSPIYTNIPRLPDIMVDPHDPGLTSTPQAMLYRERPQNYRTVIFEVDTGPPRGEDEPESGS